MLHNVKSTWNYTEPILLILMEIDYVHEMQK